MAKTTRSSHRAARSKSPANPSGSSTKATAHTERFRCPFTERFPGKNVVSKTCCNGSLDIRHVKEHIKKYHTCKPSCLVGRATSDAASPAFANGCGNPLHITEAQFKRLKDMKRRAQGETQSAHWRRIYKELFPNAPAAPTAPCLPTSDHLKATADGMTDELAMAFGARLQGAGLLGGQRDAKQAARLFAGQLSIYIEVVSLGGEGVGINSTAGLAVLASGQCQSPGLDSGVDVDTCDTSETAEPEEVMQSIELEPHDTVEEWIDKHPW